MVKFLGSTFLFTSICMMCHPGTLLNAFSPTSINTKQQSSARSSSSSSSLNMVATLFGSQGSRSPLVNWGAYELNVPLEMAQDLSKNPHPFRQIPCLTDDDGVLVFESGAILQYIYSKSDAASKDSSERQAAITSWISWANASLDPICFLETPEGKVYDTGLKKPNRRIDVLEQLLGQQDFLVKDGGFSLADVAVASYLLYVIQFFPDVNFADRWPNIVRYMKECANRDAYAQAFGSNVQTYLIRTLDAMGGKQEKKLFGMF